MKKTPRTAAFKKKVALEALREEKTLGPPARAIPPWGDPTVFLRRSRNTIPRIWEVTEERHSPAFSPKGKYWEKTNDEVNKFNGKNCLDKWVHYKSSGRLTGVQDSTAANQNG